LIGSIAFSVSTCPQRSRPSALRALGKREKKAKEADGFVAERSCRFFVLLYSQMNSLEEGYRFLPFFWKGKKNPENPVDPV